MVRHRHCLQGLTPTKKYMCSDSGVGSVAGTGIAGLAPVKSSGHRSIGAVSRPRGGAGACERALEAAAGTHPGVCHAACSMQHAAPAAVSREAVVFLCKCCQPAFQLRRRWRRCASASLRLPQAAHCCSCFAVNIQHLGVECQAHSTHAHTDDGIARNGVPPPRRAQRSIGSSISIAASAARAAEKDSPSSPMVGLWKDGIGCTGLHMDAASASAPRRTQCCVAVAVS